VLREARRADNRGRPWHGTGAELNGVFWVLGHRSAVARVGREVSSVPGLPSAIQHWIRTGKTGRGAAGSFLGVSISVRWLSMTHILRGEGGWRSRFGLKVGTVQEQEELLS
jgi:hypothetical protein